MSSNGNGKRSDFYKKRAIEIADFFTATKTIKDNPYVQRTIKDVHQIVDVILSELPLCKLYGDKKGIGRKYKQVDYVSEAALEWINNRKPSEKNQLIYEHLVPKKNHLFKDLQELVEKMSDNLEDEIFNLLDKYYFVAAITKEENETKLAGHLKDNMPKNWDKKDALARYTDAGIKIIKTQLFEEE